MKELIGTRFDYLSKQLEGKSCLLGHFTVADPYLFVILSWTRHLEIDLGKWPVLQK